MTSMPTIYSIVTCPAGYTCAADYWSLGVLIYFLLDGHLPFQASADICTAPLEFPPHFSEAAMDLLQQLLQVDVSSRLGAADGDILKIKAHKFFQVQLLKCMCSATWMLIWTVRVCIKFVDTVLCVWCRT